MGAGEGEVVHNTLVLSADGSVLGTWQVRLRRPPDLDLVDDLARLRLVCGRLGWSVALRNPCPLMRIAIDVAGLDDVLLVDDSLLADDGEALSEADRDGS